MANNNVRYVSPVVQEISALGIPLAGAQTFFYVTGTEIFKNTYSDAALTIPNSNPVVADEAGRFPNIFLEAGVYKVILWDINDVEIWSRDPVQGAVDPGLALPPIAGGAADFGKTIQVNITGDGYVLTSTLNRSYIIADAAGGGILKIKDEGALSAAAANPYVSFGYSSTVDGVYNELARVGKNNVIDGDINIDNLTSGGDINVTTTGNGNVNFITGTGNVLKNGGLLAGSYAMAVLTASGNFTTAADVTASTVFRFTLVGAGGGGAGAASGTMGGGGGGGGTSILIKSGLAASTAYTYTQGTTGTGGAAGANNGVAGTASTFVVVGTTMTSNGGLGGLTGGGGGSGGSASVTGGTIIASIVQSGGDAWDGLNANVSVPGAGAGGCSAYSSAGAPGVYQQAGRTAPGYGCGGGGGASQSAAGTKAGGNGAQGILIVERMSG